MEPDGSMLHSQGLSNFFSKWSIQFRGPVWRFGTKMIFTVLTSRQTPELEDHSCSAVHDCLFDIFTANLHIWRPTPPFAIHYHTQLLLAINCRYWEKEKITICIWSFKDKVASCKRGLLKSTRFSQKKVGYYSNFNHYRSLLIRESRA